MSRFAEPVFVAAGRRTPFGRGGGALAAYDTLTPMLKTQLGFIGVTDVAVLTAPGQGAGGEKAAASTAAAVAKAKVAAAAF